MKQRGLLAKPVFCALDWNRTNDLLLRRQTLYPLSYEGSQGSCRYRRDVLELSRKVASNGKPWKTVAHLWSQVSVQRGLCAGSAAWPIPWIGRSAQ